MECFQQTKQRSLGKMRQLSAPGSVPISKKKKQVLSHQQRRCGSAQTMFLVKQIWTIVAVRQRDAQTIKVLGDCTLGDLYYKQKRPHACMACAFLGKYASITVIDLIQRKKLDFRNFYELTKVRFEIINSLHSIRIIDGIHLKSTVSSCLAK